MNVSALHILLYDTEGSLDIIVREVREYQENVLSARDRAKYRPYKGTEDPQGVGVSGDIVTPYKCNLALHSPFLILKSLANLTHMVPGLEVKHD